MMSNNLDHQYENTISKYKNMSEMPPEDLFKLREIKAYKISSEVNEKGLRDSVVEAVHGIKNLELTNNVFQGNLENINNEMNQNSYYFNNQITYLNNLYLEQIIKTYDELKNQNIKIIEKEFKLKEQDKLLTGLKNSNIIHKEKINQQDIILNEHQHNLMDCLDKVKEYYKEVNELKNCLKEENDKINKLENKNEKEINEIKIQAKQNLGKIN